MVDVKRWEVPVPVELFKIIDRQLQAGCKRVGNTFERSGPSFEFKTYMVRKRLKGGKSKIQTYIFTGNDRLRFFFR